LAGRACCATTNGEKAKKPVKRGAGTAVPCPYSGEALKAEELGSLTAEGLEPEALAE